jgi:hypothetical protein
VLFTVRASDALSTLAIVASLGYGKEKPATVR